MIRQYERQPIENATVLLFDDNGTQSLIIEPYDGYKLRKINDNTYSTMQVGIPMQFSSLLNKYHAVPLDEPDEVVENPPIMPTEDEEISDSEALPIIISGGNDNDES